MKNIYSRKEEIDATERVAELKESADQIRPATSYGRKPSPPISVLPGAEK